MAFLPVHVPRQDNHLCPVTRALSSAFL